MTNPQYRTFDYRFADAGLIQRFSIDQMPPNSYWNHDNAEVRIENAISSRLGRHVITQNGSDNQPLLSGTIFELARLSSLNGNYRYAGGVNFALAALFRRTGDADGDYAVAATGFSGNYFSASQYRPANSATPYIFFGDSNLMLKDNGTFGLGLELWGIFAPTQVPSLSIIPFAANIIDDFNSPITSFTYVGWAAPPILTPPLLGMTTTALTGPAGIYTVDVNFTSTNFPGPHALISVGSEPDIVVIASQQATPPSTITARFAQVHFIGDDVNQYGLTVFPVESTPAVATLTRTGALNLDQIQGGQAYDADIINLGVWIGSLTGLTNIQIQFDVNDGTFSSAYTYTILPTALRFGANEVETTRGSFIPSGLAGTAGHAWANVTAYRFVVATSGGLPLGTVYIFSSFYLYGSVGPDVSNGGVPYDYRYTYYNINTGDESGPSVVLVQNSFVSPVNQPVQVNFVLSPDPQVTHTRIYRRGGTLPDQWLQVAQVPVPLTTFVDTLSDEQIAGNNILNVDTAPPVTSNLPVPVNTTIPGGVTAGVRNVLVGSGTNLFANQVVTIDPLTPDEETVILSFVDQLAPSITAYFQLNHRPGAVVQASTRTGQPVNIGCIAFDRAWLAGDPDNPNILYYSDRFNPESFPLENFLEIGVPSDPIMGVVEWNGQLYVFTQNTVWNILGAQGGGSVPLPYKTAAKHGLQAQLGFAVTEGEILYQSFGGIYSFQGAVSQYVSQPIEWVFMNQFWANQEVVRPVVPMDLTEISQTQMAYFQNEVYVSYIGTDGSRHRVIFHNVARRWRNDDAPASSMYVELDTYKLLYGDTTGLIYQDRVGNFDDGGFSGGSPLSVPISFDLQTAALDMGMPKNVKNYNELTVDIDTAGIPVTFSLVFDNGTTPLVLGGGALTLPPGRQQVDFQINAGIGQLSLNVSLLLTAAIVPTVVDGQNALASPITVYEAHIRATPEAELRKSYDSYLMDFGSPDYKFIKELWVEYTALDAAGISFNFYLEGSATPSYTFTLPQSLVRISKRIRLPATKARVWRWVATSNSDFRLYSDSRLEFKKVTNDKGYTLLPLQQEMGTQP